MGDTDARATTTARATPAEGAWRAWPWLRWSLLGLVAASWLLAAATFPLPGTESRFLRDLAAGDVRSWSQSSDPVGLPTTVVDGRDGNPTRLTVVWTTTSGARWSAHLDQLSAAVQATSDPAVDPAQQATDPTTTERVVADTSRAHGHPAPSNHLLVASGWLWPIALVDLVLLFLLALGPEPARATRWGWAWRILLLPLGIGAVWWLVGEVPWRTVERYGDDAEAHWAGRARTGGLANLVVMALLGGLLTAVGGAGVHALIGSPAATATWQVAHSDGTIESVPVPP